MDTQNRCSMAEQVTSSFQIPRAINDQQQETESLVGVDEKSLFYAMLHSVASQLRKRELLQIIRLLHGHIGRETLQQIDTGHDLLRVLHRRGLLQPRKLALLRKVAVEAGLCWMTKKINNFVFQRQQLEDTSGNSGTRKADQVLKGVKARYLDSIELLKSEAWIIQLQIEEKQDHLEELEKNLKDYKNSILDLKNGQFENERNVKELSVKIKELENMEMLICNQLAAIKEKVDINGSQKKQIMNQDTETVDRRTSGFEVAVSKVQLKSLENELNILHEDQESKSKDALHVKEKIDQTKHLLQAKISRLFHIKKEMMELTEKAVSTQEGIIQTLKECMDKEELLHQKKNGVEKLMEEINMLRIEHESLKKREFSGKEIIMKTDRLKQKCLEQESQSMVLHYRDLKFKDSYCLTYLNHKSEKYLLKQPKCICCHGDNIYIVDSSSLLITDLWGWLAHPPYDLTGFNAIDMSVSSDGRIYVINPTLLKILDPTCKDLHQVLPEMTASGLVPNLTAITINEEDNIFILDSANYQLQRFSRDGNFINIVWGIEKVRQPRRIHVHGDQLAISDWETDSVHIFSLKSSSGSNHRIGQYGIFEGHFSEPCGLTRDSKNNLIVADSDNHRIQVFDSCNRHLATIGMYGKSLGFLNNPVDIAVYKCALLLVADYGNNRIVIWGHDLGNLF